MLNSLVVQRTRHLLLSLLFTTCSACLASSPDDVFPMKGSAYIKLISFPDKTIQPETCSGILVAKNLVLTNAHCFDKIHGKDIHPFKVSFPSSRNTRSYEVESFDIHPDYRDNINIYKDIAWIKLKEAVHLPLKPAMIAHQKPKTQSTLYFLGYAYGHLRLMKSESTIPLTNSSQTNFDQFIISSDGRELARPGDSGGPVYVYEDQQYKILGIILENSYYFTEKISTSLIRISYFREWIERSSGLKLTTN